MSRIPNEHHRPLGPTSTWPLRRLVTLIALAAILGAALAMGGMS